MCGHIGIPYGPEVDQNEKDDNLTLHDRGLLFVSFYFILLTPSANTKIAGRRAINPRSTWASISCREVILFCCKNIYPVIVADCIHQFGPITHNSHSRLESKGPLNLGSMRSYVATSIVLRHSR